MQYHSEPSCGCDARHAAIAPPSVGGPSGKKGVPHVGCSSFILVCDLRIPPAAIELGQRHFDADGGSVVGIVLLAQQPLLARIQDIDKFLNVERDRQEHGFCRILRCCFVRCMLDFCRLPC
jgi:hypothetical protein